MTIQIKKTNSKQRSKSVGAKKIITRPAVEDSRYFSPAEAAFAAGISTVTIYRALALNQKNAEKGLSHFRLGRLIRISGSQLRNWIEKESHQTGRSAADLQRERAAVKLTN